MECSLIRTHTQARTRTHTHTNTRASDKRRLNGSSLYSAYGWGSAEHECMHVCDRSPYTDGVTAVYEVYDGKLKWNRCIGLLQFEPFNQVDSYRLRACTTRLLCIPGRPDKQHRARQKRQDLSRSMQIGHCFFVFLTFDFLCHIILTNKNCSLIELCVRSNGCAEKMRWTIAVPTGGEFVLSNGDFFTSADRVCTQKCS